MIQERRDVGVQDPVHGLALDRDRKRVQRIMLAAPRSEAVAEAEEVLLVDGVQHLGVVIPRHPIHPGGRIALERAIRLPQQIDVDMVEQSRERELSRRTCR